jgi:hypothetical protein
MTASSISVLDKVLETRVITRTVVVTLVNLANKVEIGKRVALGSEVDFTFKQLQKASYGFHTSTGLDFTETIREITPSKALIKTRYM